MAKIIEHNFSRKRGRDLLTASFGYYMQEIEDKKRLLGEMVMQARLFLSQEGMDPTGFVLSESYLREFFAMKYGNSDIPQNSYAEIVYIKHRNNSVVALCQFASPEEDGISISYQIYSLDNIHEGNRRWSLYNFKSRTWVEDEEDCFDLTQIFGEIDMFSDRNDMTVMENKD